MGRNRADAKGTAKATAKSTAKTTPGVVRIIGGQYKRTLLPVAHKPGLRPTPDRVRETLFNWLGQDLSGWRCADAFAGTGALGFEAASRGAAQVLMWESDPALVQQLHAVQTKLQATAVTIRRGDGVAGLGGLAPASLDLVLLDPPFDADLFAPALKASARVLPAQGLIYLEAPTLWNDAACEAFGLVVYRHLKAGAVHAHVLKRADSLAL